MRLREASAAFNSAVVAPSSANRFKTTCCRVLPSASASCCSALIRFSIAVTSGGLPPSGGWSSSSTFFIGLSPSAPLLNASHSASSFALYLFMTLDIAAASSVSLLPAALSRKFLPIASAAIILSVKLFSTSNSFSMLLGSITAAPLTAMFKSSERLFIN